MNDRTRQWLKVSHRLEKYDPSIVALVPIRNKSPDMFQMKSIHVFRRSQYTKVREQYGDELEVILGDL